MLCLDTMVRLGACAVLVLAAVQGSSSAEAQPTVTLPGGIAVHGAVDVYADGNFNAPGDHQNFLPGTGTSGKRANEASVNLASIELVKEPAPLGFHLWLAAGTGAEVVHAGETTGVAAGPEVWKYVQQASVSGRIPIGRGLLIEGGIYPSHIGFESLPSRANWNYTRSWLGEFSPYYQTGIKASYAFTDHLSAQVHLLNGWQLIGDNNDGKAFGTQLAWTDERLSMAFNTFVGPEYARDDSDWRFFGDFVATVSLSGTVKLGISVDAGLQQRPRADTVPWHGAALFGRWQFARAWAAAGRAEYYRDAYAIFTGVGQTLLEGTGTLEFKPMEALLLKLEGRHDHSTRDVFSGGTAPLSDQTLVLVGAVASF